MGIVRTFKKTILATTIAGILPSCGIAASITVTPSSPDQIPLPDVSGVVDNILFRTNNQVVEKTLGNESTEKLVVKEVTLDDQSGSGGQVIFHMTAKDMELGSTAWGSLWSNPQPTNNQLHIEANKLVADGETKSAFSLYKCGSIKINENSPDAIVNISSGSTTAVYLSEESNFQVNGKDIDISSSVSKGSTSGTLYGIDESQFSANASNRLTVSNSNGGYALRIYGNATYDLQAQDELSVTTALDKTAISISQSDKKRSFNCHGRGHH